MLLTGETGSGKEVVAQAIHSRSRRRDRPFVTINCAGIPDTLLESEFFGHARGSFTGAMRDSPGLLRQADGGTVLLDEVGEMSLRLQALLLRFLETGEIQTVGGGVTRAVDVRVIAATNRNLRESTAAREFREDLYYRLNVFHIAVAPLRERREDIPLLLDHYFGDVEPPPRAAAGGALRCAPATCSSRYSWPGNVRELRNLVERLVVSVRRTVDRARASVRTTSCAKRRPCPRTRPTRSQLMSHRGRVERSSSGCSRNGSRSGRARTRRSWRATSRGPTCGSSSRPACEQTHGSYRVLLGLFNMDPDDYKRFTAVPDPARLPSAVSAIPRRCAEGRPAPRGFRGGRRRDEETDRRAASGRTG